jgi:hypothetical protein
MGGKIQDNKKTYGSLCSGSMAFLEIKLPKLIK